MVAIPKYNENKVNVDRTPSAYSNVSNISGDAFGVNIAKAQEKLGEASLKFSDAMAHLYTDIEDAQAVELGNYIDQLEKEALLNPENGYYSKRGKDAMANPDDPTSGATGVLSDIESKINQKQQELGLTWGYGAKKAELIKSRKMEMLYRGATAHELKQTQEYATATMNDASNLAISKGIIHRDNNDDMNTALLTGKAAILKNAQIMHWDNDTTKIQLAKFESDFHTAVITAYADDNSLKISDYYEQHKDKLLPQAQIHCLSLMNNTETKVLSKSLSDNLFNLYPEEEEKALSELDKKYDRGDISLEQYDATRHRLSGKYSQIRRIEEQRISDLYKQGWDNFANKIKNGQTITIDDIPNGLDGHHYINMRNAIESLNTTGDVETDVETQTSLWYMAENDAQRFKGIDLSIYRCSLSKEDYNSLLQRQQAIQKGDYYTVVKGTDGIKDYIKQVSGLDGDDENVINQYQNSLRAFEEKQGRKATDIEKEQILKYLGSNKNYKDIQKIMKNYTDFNSDLANKIKYYQSRHNNEMPPVEMVNQWVRDISVQYSNKKYSAMKNLVYRADIKPVAGEQKTLTYFADVTVPELSNKIGANLKISSRYREPNGKYKSHHSEGRAMDISYKTIDGKKLTVEQRIKLVSEVIANPNVQKIAISSADAEGKAVLKGLGIKDKKYYSKIQDTYTTGIDKKLGTDHTNHLHITFYDDKTTKSNDIVTIKNQLKARGYSQEQIAAYIKQKGLN